MKHNEAQQSHAVERYILNEMNDDERDRFEEHYFECSVCAADVVDGERLMASGRAMMRETPAVVAFAPRRSWKAWMPAVAAAMLLAANVTVVAPRLSGPLGARRPTSEIVEAQSVRRGANRSANEAPPLIELRAGVTNELIVDLVFEEEFPRYELRLRDGGGRVVVKQRVPAESGDGVHWLLSSLPAGSYVLAIHGDREDGNFPVIATYEVRVR